MESTNVSIRNLKARLSEYLRIVKAGGTVTITDRGHPIGRIVPIADSVDRQMDTLREAGVVTWSGEVLGEDIPRVKRRGGKTLAEIVVEDRE